MGLATLLLMVGCAGSGAPTYAFDPIWIEPEGDGIHGFQTWSIYADGWQRRYKERYFVCSVVVELSGTPAATPCPDCDFTWAVTPELAETDCTDESLASAPGFLSLTGLGLGAVPSALRDNNPYPSRSQGSYADYGADWVSHGWGYPESLDTRGEASDAGWGAQPFELWPAFYWDQLP